MRAEFESSRGGKAKKDIRCVSPLPPAWVPPLLSFFPVCPFHPPALRSAFHIPLPPSFHSPFPRSLRPFPFSSGLYYGAGEGDHWDGAAVASTHKHQVISPQLWCGSEAAKWDLADFGLQTRAGGGGAGTVAVIAIGATASPQEAALLKQGVCFSASASLLPSPFFWPTSRPASCPALALVAAHSPEWLYTCVFPDYHIC